MLYNKYTRIGANWWTTAKYSDFPIPYPVVDYTKYAASFDEFMSKYPYFEVETDGKTYSAETFGDQGKGQFGTKRYEILNFSKTFYHLDLVNSHDSTDGYNVGSEIGLGFKKDNRALYLQPFVNAWMYSVGRTWRYLSIGLEVSKITFCPNDVESEMKIEVILLNNL